MTSTPRIPSHHPAPRSHFLERLDAEWAHLRTSRRALRTARGWGLRYPAHPLADIVSDLDDLDQIRRATQRCGNAERRDDAILLALVELSRSDELAGRIVLQHLLPALIVHAQRYRSFRDRTDPVAHVVPAAWIAIRAYDVDKRRHHVASSLVSDAVFQAFRRPLRARSATEKVVAPCDFAATPSSEGPGDALVEFVTVLRDAQGAGVPAADLDLLRQLVCVGSPGVVAQQRNVTPRTIRNHRNRAIDHVRRALAAAA
jgi:hypothetical protein